MVTQFIWLKRSWIYRGLKPPVTVRRDGSHWERRAALPDPAAAILPMDNRRCCLCVQSIPMLRECSRRHSLRRKRRTERRRFE